MAKKSLSKQQVKGIIPFLKEFNGLSRVFISLLNQNVAVKRERVSRIAVMVSDIAKPEVRHTINIQTVDMRNTTVKRVGETSYNQKMDWEADFLKQRRKFII
ncbi:MAG: hypothetical protein AB7F28_07725 [Candidatus Margulisiibacteriota bacterium]